MPGFNLTESSEIGGQRAAVARVGQLACAFATVLLAACNSPTTTETVSHAARSDPHTFSASMQAYLAEVEAAAAQAEPMAFRVRLAKADAEDALLAMAPQPEPVSFLLTPEASESFAATRFERDGVPFEFPMAAFDLAGPELQGRLLVGPRWARILVRENRQSYLGHVGDIEARGEQFSQRPVRRNSDEVPPECASIGEPDFSRIGERGGVELWFDAVLDASRDLVEYWGQDTPMVQAAMLQAADLIFSDEVGVRLRATLIHQHTSGWYHHGANDFITPFNDMHAWWREREPERDFVLLNQLEGDSSHAQVHCIGAAGQADSAYATATVRAEHFSVPWASEKSVAHEIGHLFAARHHFANPVEGIGGTLMLGLPLNLREAIFSDLSSLHIRDWAERLAAAP